MKSTSSKNILKKLERKKAEMESALESRRLLEEGIRQLQEEIETLQSEQIEQIFQRLKKSILKEGLSVDADDIPDILDIIRDSQGQTSSQESGSSQKPIPEGKKIFSGSREENNRTEPTGQTADSSSTMENGASRISP